MEPQPPWGIIPLPRRQDLPRDTEAADGQRGPATAEAPRNVSVWREAPSRSTGPFCSKWPRSGGGSPGNCPREARAPQGCPM